MENIEKGYYYHYKHDPVIEHDAVYEVVGTALNAESGGAMHSDDPSDFLKDEVVLYRPLFKNSLVYKNGKRFWIRPVSMFFNTVEKNGKTMNRFTKITDSKLIKKLEQIKKEMYGE